MTVATQVDDAVLDHLFEEADFDEATAELAERLERDEDRTLAYIARRIQTLIAIKEPLDHQRDAMLEHYRSTAGPLMSQIQYLSDVVADTLRARRSRNPGVKSLTLLGVGEWKSRKVTDGWNVDERIVLEKLTADEAVEFTEPKPHLVSAKLREHLDNLLAPAKRELNEDMSEEERIERLRVVVEAIEAQYGVTYRPERISIKGPLE